MNDVLPFAGEGLTHGPKHPDRSPKSEIGKITTKA
jgi:hypothetical protein